MSDFEYFGGIDFSGAKEPLANLWSAVGAEKDGKLHILALQPHPFRMDLCAYVAEGWRGPWAAADAPILWGADFPFGIPAEAARQLPAPRTGSQWEGLVAWVADRPADEVRSTFADHQRAMRRTDLGAAMSPFDLRLYKQTTEGMRWLHELGERQDVSVVPQAPSATAATTLVEVYPSASIIDLGIRCRRTPSRVGEVRARPAALRTFVTFADPSLEAIAVTLEDAWDAVIACLTAWMVRDDLDQPFRLGKYPREVLELEGWIYRTPAALG